jgi:AcrR family transcriptional regulator
MAQRLKHEERRAALLRAARELSVERGGAAFSLDEVIRRAGGSRRSIYTGFGGKAGLLAALVDEISSGILSSLSEIGEQRDLHATLTRFARNILAVLMSEGGIGLSRIILKDSMISPERAPNFFASGPGKGAQRLAQILEAARKRGEIEVQDSILAAHCFIGMVRANLFLSMLLQLRPPPGKAEAETHVHTVVDIFLNGVKPRPP